MRKILSIFLVVLPLLSMAQFAPSAGRESEDAINADDPAFVGWATGCVVTRGPVRIDRPQQGLASYGTDEDALGKADDSLLVSLGDGGNAVLTFASPICNQEGPDFAVFENAFVWNVDTTLNFMELAFVEVSSDGEYFVRFPAVSLLQDTVQFGSFQCTDPTLVHNLAGNHPAHFGTPFDLDELPADDNLNVNRITHVRVVDVVGCIKPEYATYDSEGHIVNDPWPTAFNSCGFDLDAVGVIHDVAHSGVDDYAHEALLVYPNPTSTTLSVKTEQAVTMKICSLTGQQLLSVEGNTVDVSMLSNGMYLVCIAIDGKTIVNKFVKN